MKNYKRVIMAILTVSLLFGMCACSNKKDNDEVSVETPIELTSTPDVVETEEIKPHTTNYSENEVTEKVTIVVDGKEITPTDNNGETVETIIHNGIVYLPVKTVADAMGKAYYWDGPKFTAYLGDMGGSLEYPTVELEKMVNIGDEIETTERLKDNYGNQYSRAVWNYSGYDIKPTLEYNLNMKYTKFKGTLYIPEGETCDESITVRIIADDKTIYTSPEMKKTSYPVDLDIDITGYNNFKIEWSDITGNKHSIKDYYLSCCLGDAGFYQ